MRRLLLLIMLALILLSGCTARRPAQISFRQTIEYPAPSQVQESLRLGVVSMLSPRESFPAQRDLADYLGARTGRPVDLILRKTYSEMNDLVRSGAVEMAMVGYGGFLAGEAQYGMLALAASLVDGTTESDAVLLVRTESDIEQFQRLEGRPIAFTDPLSVSGHLVLRQWMADQRLLPESFFSRVLFTFSHGGSIEALVGRVVDAAMVDALQFRTYMLHHPELDGKLQVILRLQTHGGMQFVVRPDLPPERRATLQAVLLQMHEDPRGRRVLAQLLIERLVPPPQGGEGR